MGRRRSWSTSVIRSAASSGAIEDSSRAASPSDRLRTNSSWCSVSSSSKTSASSSRSAPTASMISSPSSWDAASTRSAIWAGCSLASLRYGIRRRDEGTWATKGSMLAQSTMRPRLGIASAVPRDQAAKEGAARGVDGHHLPGPVDLGQLDVVGTDQTTAHEVDQVMGQKIPGQEQLAGATLEATEIDPTALEPDPARLEGSHLADGDEEVAPADGHDQADHRRVGRLAGPDDQVLDPSQAIAGSVDQRPLDDVRQVEDLEARPGLGRLCAHRGPSVDGEPGSGTGPRRPADRARPGHRRVGAAPKGVGGLVPRPGRGGTGSVPPR